MTMSKPTNQRANEPVFEPGDIVRFNRPHLDTGIECRGISCKRVPKKDETRLSFEAKGRPMLVLTRINATPQGYQLLMMTSTRQNDGKDGYFRIGTRPNGTPSLVKCDRVEYLPQNLAKDREGALEQRQFEAITRKVIGYMGYGPKG